MNESRQKKNIAGIMTLICAVSIVSGEKHNDEYKEKAEDYWLKFEN